MRDCYVCEVEHSSASFGGRVDLDLYKLAKLPQSDGGVILVLIHPPLLSNFKLLVTVDRKNSHKHSCEDQKGYHHSLTIFFLRATRGSRLNRASEKFRQSSEGVLGAILYLVVGGITTAFQCLGVGCASTILLAKFLKDIGFMVTSQLENRRITVDCS